MQEILSLKNWDHPNIVKIYEIFKDSKNLYIVMEFVEGKELFDYVVERHKLKESDAWNIVKQLLKTIKYIHSIGIIHRDLKPENIIINPTTKKIKLIDFGLSSYFKDFQHLHTKVGTPYYVAPEVLDGDYGCEIDIWSVGVIAYILLTGYPPFQGKNNNIIYQKIKACQIRFYDAEWVGISTASKDFIKRVLVKEIDKRLTVEDGLNHKWFKQANKLQSEITPDIVKKLARFKIPDMLKKEIFLILANQIDSATVDKWTMTFESLDTEGTGMIKIDALIKTCKESGAKTAYLEQLKEMHGGDGDFTINYSDFLAKVIDINKEVDDFNIEKAFQTLDTDGSGKITKEDLALFLKRKGDDRAEENAQKFIKSAQRKLKRDSKPFEMEETSKNFLLLNFEV